MTRTKDLLDELAEIKSASALAEARALRGAATEHTQGSHEILFSSASKSFPLSWRAALARQVALWHQAPQLANYYASLPSQPAEGAGLQAALAHAETLTFTPAAATQGDLHALREAGWSVQDIVTLSQLVAFVSFQSRLLTGLRLLAGHSVPRGSHDAVAAVWRSEPRTATGQPAPQAFTQRELHWEPWLAAKPLDEFNALEQATLAKFGHADSDYFRLLARNLPLLEQRTLTDKGIFYTSGGLPRAERELAAAVASKVNGCIYCASVHARKASQLSKQTDDVARLIATPPGQALETGQSDRWQKIIAFSAALSTTPPNASPRQLDALREIGLDELQLLDLVQSSAFFAWANRLMLTLGEPFE
ncbi:alkylhydroperoxidase domain protein [Pantoea sp. CCBC3-3-1]|uniref:alkylhydroperoxidase domain protein n=1 Tax=Pantoea sp. CCBC3-3-1 TaxID=2490851 RepID=UPI0011BF8021|nr:alkylhydroperoxidase domain protein [Pantoea sp. CCBC3-3-1]